MRHNIVAAKLIVLFVLFSINALSAQEKTTEVQKATGRLKSFDYKNNSMLLVTKEGKTISFDVTPKTKITKWSGLENTKISDIQPGSTANVVYQAQGTKHVAVAVEITESRPGGCPEGQPCPDDEREEKKSGTKQKKPQ